MNDPDFPPVLLEAGALGRLGELLQRLRAQELFFVADPPAYELSGAARILDPIVTARKTTWFTEFALNPRIEDVERGVARFREVQPEVVIALGGGSALDMGKLIAGCGVQAGAPGEYASGQRTLERTGPPKILIPTTAGTGSEATHFAVVYVADQKYSMAHPSLLPEYVLIDPTLTYSLPPRPTAACGLDALCQAVESIWAVGADTESLGYATEALELALAHLENAVLDPRPPDRWAMARAAHLAGRAINISKTTAPHAFSYALTTRFQVPHGAAVALTLGAFLGYNHGVDDTTCADPRGAAAVRERLQMLLDLMGEGSLAAAQARLRLLMLRIGCPVRLGEVGVRRADLPGLIQAVNMERLSNNPRGISEASMMTLLEAHL